MKFILLLQLEINAIVRYNVMSCILTYYLGIFISFSVSYVFRGSKNAAPRAALDECSNMASRVRQEPYLLEIS
jgi:hypothetical protein